MDTSSPEFWFGLIGTICTTISIGWVVIAHFSNRRYQQKEKEYNKEKDLIRKDVKLAMATGEKMISSIDAKVDSNYELINQKLLISTEDIDDVKAANTALEKRVRVLEAQQMTEVKVESKLRPIKEEVDEVKTSMKELRDDFKSHAAMSEMNIQQVLSKVADTNSSIARVEGYLKAQSEKRND